MRLAVLIYECVKDSINFASSISFDSFIMGDFDDDRDFETQISGVFSCANLAFSRLAAGMRIPLKLEECDVGEDGFVPFSKGRVVNAVDQPGQGYRRIPFRTSGDSFGIVLVAGAPSNGKVWLEYEPELPHWSMSDIREERLDESNEWVMAEKEIDLMDYGIDRVMCDYVKEFVKGTLLEYVSPDSAKWHLNLAEQYMKELRPRTTAFYQGSVMDAQGGWVR